MLIDPTLDFQTFFVFLGIVVLPLALIWLLDRAARSQANLWRILILVWVAINTIAALILIGMASFSIELRHARSDGWLLEEVFVGITLIALPLLYALLGTLSYSRRFKGNGVPREGR